MVRSDPHHPHSIRFDVQGSNYKELDEKAKAQCALYFGEDRIVRYSVSASPLAGTVQGHVVIWEGSVSAHLVQQ